MKLLMCPVCGAEVSLIDKTLKCDNNHCFDFAKEGYVNLLLSGKSGDDRGDNKEMARSRRDFLNSGCYVILAEAVGECVKKFTSEGDSVLDICCGEGYYTDYISKRYSRDYFGFDISKNMVRLAAKRKCGASFFVANISSIPVKSGSVKLAFHLFAPFHAAEFGRILADGGVIVTAVPGKKHLFGLKRVLYNTPYTNDEQPPESDGMTLIDTVRVNGSVTLNGQQNINALFSMTPYYYHTPSEGMKRLEALDTLTTEIEFVLYIYKKAVGI